MVIMGLGNPGPRYERTRHNVGYHVADFIMQEPPLRFRRRLFESYLHSSIPGETDRRSLLMVRFTGFMNRSGEIIPALMRRYGVTAEDIIVIVDNMDLQPGVCRLKKGGGNAGHNGLKSLIRYMGNGVFYRLYIGIGRPSPGIDVVDYVLGEPGGTEALDITKTCLRAAASIKELAYKPFTGVMEELNRREP